MNKKIRILFYVILCLVTGCSAKTNQKFYLAEKYYNQEGTFLSINSDQIETLDGETYVLFIYNNFCSMEIPCEDIFKEFIEKYHINFYSMSFTDFKNTKFYETVKYGPSILIIKEGKIVTYLDANKDEDLDKYQKEEVFEKWLANYIYFSNEE